MGNKRKLKSKGADETKEIPAKKSHDESDPEDQADPDIREPTKQEIEESYKPENVINVKTVRDKKRDVHKQIVEKKKEIGDQREVEGIRMYLNKWKDDRDSWKFEKRKQIYIQTNCFEPSKVPDEDWGTCLAYLEASKGKSREMLIAAAEKLISTLDGAESKDDVAMIKYNRSRDLLQMLN